MKNRRFILITNVLIFLFVFIYFTQISPLVPFDSDDWCYVGGMRLPFPMWGAWNPTKVLPETLMGIGGYIAAFIVFPFNKDYITAIVYVEAFIVVAFISTFLLCYNKLLIKRFKFSSRLSIASEVFFLLSFFLLFKHLNQPSYNGFWTVDLTCDFNYLIPGLLNASMLMYMEQSENFYDYFNRLNNTSKGLFILALYFTLFSSTQSTIIVSTYSFFKIIQIFIKNSRKLNTSFLKLSSIYFLILLIWLGSVIFDLNGQRSKIVQSMNKVSFMTGINETIKQTQNFFQIQNKKIVVIFIIIIIVAIIYAIKVNKNDKFLFIGVLCNTLLCLISSFLYLVIVYAKAGSEYAARPDAMWAVIFFFLFAVNISFAFLLNNIKALRTLVPLLLVLSFLIAFNLNYLQIPANNVPYSATTVKKVDNYIINQIKNADKKGKSVVIVKVPEDQENASSKLPAANWPHSYEMAGWLQNTLYTHKIIRSRIKVIFKPDKGINNLYENKENQQPFISFEYKNIK